MSTFCLFSFKKHFSADRRTFVLHSVINCFRTEACQVFITQKLLPSKIPLTMKFPLNIFSDQITICQISFEIFDAKQINT